MKERLWITFILGLLLVLLTAMVALAANGVAVDWWVLAGGGAPASGDSLAMNSTLGQPVVGHSTGDDVSLSAGYWYAGAEYVLYMPLVMRNCSP